MWRAYCYFRVNAGSRFGLDLARLTSEVVDSEDAADQLLDKLLLTPGVNGGGVEHHVPGIGWVLEVNFRFAVHLRPSTYTPKPR